MTRLNTAQFKTMIHDQLKSKSKRSKTKYTSRERQLLGLHPQEDDIQIQIIEECKYLRFNKIPVAEIIRHIPNGGYRTDTEGARLKKMGVVAGTPRFTSTGTKGRLRFALY